MLLLKLAKMDYWCVENLKSDLRWSCSLIKWMFSKHAPALIQTKFCCCRNSSTLYWLCKGREVRQMLN